MSSVLVLRCASCGAPLASVSGMCRYCRATNVVVTPDAREKTHLDGDLTLIGFTPTPLLQDIPAWLFLSPPTEKSAVVVLPTVGETAHEGIAGTLSGLNHYLAERLVLDTGLSACSSCFMHNATRTVAGPSAERHTRAEYKRIFSNHATMPALVWVEVDKENEPRLHLVSANGTATAVRAPLAELADATIAWAKRTLAARSVTRPSWYRAPAPAELERYLGALGTDAQLLFAEGLEGTTSLATRTFASMRDAVPLERTCLLVDATLAHVERDIGRFPQFACIAAHAMTAADKRDVLDEPRCALLSALASRAQPFSPLHAMSPWFCSFVGANLRANARMCALRPTALGTYAEWLDAIDDEERIAPDVFDALRSLPTSSGPRDIRTGVGLVLGKEGPLEFGASLADIERVFGARHPPEPDDGGDTVRFAGGVLAELSDGALLCLCVADDPTCTFHGVALFGCDEATLVAFWQARGIGLKREELDDGEFDLLVPALELRFSFEEEGLFAIKWSEIAPA